MSPSSISSSKAKLLSVFLGASLGICACLLFGFEAVLYRLRETWPVEKVLARQRATGEFYLPKYIPVGLSYKIRGIRLRRPAVLAMGSSRMMQLREESFPAQALFYNASVDEGEIGGVGGFLRILRSLDESQRPRVVIVGLDPWHFNPQYPLNRDSLWNRLKSRARGNRLGAALMRWRKFARDRGRAYQFIVNEKRDILPTLRRPELKRGIGLDAQLHGCGFRTDGSFVYPPEASGPREPSAAEFLASAWRRFPPAEDLDAGALRHWNGFLDFARGRGIRVIVMLIPFRPDLHQALMADDVQRRYMEAFRSRITLTARGKGFEIFDFSDPATLGLKRGDFVDFLHLQEWAIARTAREICAGKKDDCLDKTLSGSYIGG